MHTTMTAATVAVISFPPESSTPPAALSKAAIYDCLLRALEAAGLTDTADCLCQEAKRSGNGNLEVASDVGFGSKLVLETLAQQHASAHAVIDRHRHGLEQCAQEMIDQKNRMGELVEELRQLRAEEGTASERQVLEAQQRHRSQEMLIQDLQTDCASMFRLEALLREHLERRTEEFGELQRSFEQRKMAETELRVCLESAEIEAQILRGDITALYASIPPPTSPRSLTIDLIRGILAAWDQPWGLRERAAGVFAMVDTGLRGHLEWNSGEIKAFVCALFSRHGVQKPNWQEHVWYDMYRNCDKDGSYSLEFEESLWFARVCFEAALQAMIASPQSIPVCNSNSAIQAHVALQWRSTPLQRSFFLQAAGSLNGTPRRECLPPPSYASPVLPEPLLSYSTPVRPSTGTSSLTYPGGTQVIFDEFAEHFASTSTANARHFDRMVAAIESGTLTRLSEDIYGMCSQDSMGALAWHGGTISKFIHAIFDRQGLTPPLDEMLLPLVLMFDRDRKMALDRRACLCLADALFRSVFHRAHTAQSTVGGRFATTPLVVTHSAVQAGSLQGSEGGHW